MDADQAARVKAARARLAKKFKGVNTKLGGKGTQKRKLKKKEKELLYQVILLRELVK